MQIISENRIDFLDERFYTKEIEGDIKYYPSVTYILGEGYPKGAGFEQFLKDTGENSRVVAERAAEGGTIVHDCLHSLVTGKELLWTDQLKIPLKYHGEFITKEEWEAVLKFKEFWEMAHPKLIAAEVTVFNDKYQYAGTIDLICEIGKDRWLIDYKFSNAVYESYELQVAAYAYAWNKSSKLKVNHIGILHLKAQTRTLKPYQGKGWKLHEPELSPKDLFTSFLSVRKIFSFKQTKGLLPKAPSIVSLPIKIKL
jgi:hypothetical protein